MNHRKIMLAAALSLTLIGAWASAKSVGSAATRGSGKATFARDGWPETRAGMLGRGWVLAFDSGDSAMRAFLDEDDRAQIAALPGFRDHDTGFGLERF